MKNRGMILKSIKIRLGIEYLEQVFHIRKNLEEEKNEVCRDRV